MVSGVVALGVWLLLFRLLDDLLQPVPQPWRWLVVVILFFVILVGGLFLFLIGFPIIYERVTGKKVDYR
jgi:uncharacterized protein YhhL (DUF1145 family)